MAAGITWWCFSHAATAIPSSILPFPWAASAETSLPSAAISIRSQALDLPPPVLQALITEPSLGLVELLV